MSDCEWITQVTQDKCATVSESLRLLMINKRMSDLLKKFWFKNQKSYFWVFFMYVFYLKKWVIPSFPHFWWVMWANRSGRSPKMSDHERFAQVTHQKWVNRLFFRANRSFAHFSQKTSNSLRKVMSEFPALKKSKFKYLLCLFHVSTSYKLSIYRIFLRGSYVTKMKNEENYLLYLNKPIEPITPIKVAKTKKIFYHNCRVSHVF